MVAMETFRNTVFSFFLFTQLQFLSTSLDIRNFTLFVSLMANLRCISFSMDYCWRLREPEKDKPVKPYTLMDLLVYNFYLPLFANGPVVTFDTFQKTVSGF